GPSERRLVRFLRQAVPRAARRLPRLPAGPAGDVRRGRGGDRVAVDITCPKCQARLQAPNGKKQALPTHCPFCGQAFARPKKKESVFRPENPSSAPSKPAAQVDEWEPKRKEEIAPP